LRAALFYAVRRQAALGLSDVMLWRLWHTQGGGRLHEECWHAAGALVGRERPQSRDDGLTTAA